MAPPCPVLFVDGVRRIEARVWIDDVTDGSPATEASAAICASYAAGVVCCCDAGAHLLTAETRRGLFTVAPHAEDMGTSAGAYAAFHTLRSENAAVGDAVERAAARLADIELLGRGRRAAATGRARRQRTTICWWSTGRCAGGATCRGPSGTSRATGPRTCRRSNTRWSARCGPAQRTPVFRMGTSWDRYSWYLRLPCLPERPVGRHRARRVLPRPAASMTSIALADLSQATLVRFASTEYKDSRAPQNLYPIAGLERELRRRLGDSRLLYRALRGPPRCEPTTRWLAHDVVGRR